MQARTFWRAVTVDRTDVRDRVLAAMGRLGTRFCVIGGVAVNAYVEPVVTLDLALVIVSADLADIEHHLRDLRVERFPHSVNISARGSDLRIQFQTDPRYQAFIAHAAPHDVLGVTLPVAALEDVFQGKLWAVQDADRRASKRQKDLADIARLIEAYPALLERVPDDVRRKLL